MDAAVEMARRQGFMARPLPDEMQAGGIGRSGNTLITLRCLAELVFVQKDEAVLERIAAPRYAQPRTASTFPAKA